MCTHSSRNLGPTDRHLTLAPSFEVAFDLKKSLKDFTSTSGRYCCEMIDSNFDKLQLVELPWMFDGGLGLHYDQAIW